MKIEKFNFNNKIEIIIFFSCRKINNLSTKFVRNEIQRILPVGKMMAIHLNIFQQITWSIESGINE